jgi:hypothetical protein
VSRLVFSAGNHSYSLDGTRVPGVTTIGKRAERPDGLIRWAARSAAEYAAAHVEELPSMGEASWVAHVTKASDRLRDASMIAGKQLHSIAERLVYGEPVETSDPETGEAYADDVVRMGEQVARFMDSWDVTPDTALVERPVFHDAHRYAGTFDLCAVLRGGDRWLIDYKTGSTGVWPETSMQLTAYSRATHVQIRDRDLLMPPIQRCAALWVRPDTWELLPVKSDDDTFDAFLHAMRVHRWTQRRRDDLIGAPLPIPEAS